MSASPPAAPRAHAFRFGALAFAALLLFSPWRGRGITRSDPQTYFHIGWEMTRGKVLYRDLWEHKPPLIFVTGMLNALAGRDSGGRPYIDLLALSVALAACYRLGAAPYGRGMAALAAFLYCILIFRNDAYFNGPYMPEVYAAPFSLLSILAATRLFETGGGGDPAPERARAFLAGFLGIIACMYKESSALTLAPWHLYLIAKGVLRKNARGVRFALPYAAGISIPLAIFWMYLARHGALKEWFEAEAYNRELLINVGEVGPAHWLADALTCFNSTYCFGKLWLFALCAASGVCLSIFSSPAAGRFTLLVAASFMLECASLHLARVRLFHYYNQLAWSFSLLTVSPFAILFAAGAALKNRAARAAVRACCVACVSLISSFVLLRSSYIYPDERAQFSAADAYAETLRQNSAPDDTVQNIGGNDSLSILNCARRQSATRFLDQYAFVIGDSSEGCSRRKKEFLGSIAKNPPDFIVWGVGPPFCPYTRNLLEPALVEHLQAYIKQNYEAVPTPGFEDRVFRRRNYSPRR